MTNNSIITSIDILSEIASTHTAIEQFSICLLDFAPLLQNRSNLSDLDREITAQALELRSSLNLPFWDGALLSSMASDTAPRGIIEGANFHQSLQGKVTPVSSNNFTRDLLLSSAADASAKGKILAINSSVILSDGTEKHIPLLDFHVAYSIKATSLILTILSILGIKGWLFNSGKSYHFYGDNLVSTSELGVFLGRLLLFSPIVDRCWIAHQMIERSCTLRISPRPEYGSSPTLVCRI